MDITETSLWEDVQDVLDSGPNAVHYAYRCSIDNGEEQIDPRQITLIDVDRNYLTQYGDQTTITVRLSRRDYERKIYPNKEDLYITLTKEPLGETSDDEDFDQEVITRRYRAVLAENRSSLLEQSTANAADESVMDTEPDYEYTFQLIDPALEILRTKSTGGIFTDMTTTGVVQGLMTQLANDLDLEEDSNVQGVDVVEGTNNRTYTHIVLPHGVRYTQIPETIQELYGLYSSGLGVYYQTGVWYVFPAYNVKRFDQVPDPVTIINVPPRRLHGIERTYLQDDQSLIILSTGQVVHDDQSEVAQMNVGTGVRYAKSENIMEGFHSVEENKATVTKSENIREYSVHDRSSKQAMALFSPARITDNVDRESSRLAEGLGFVVKLIWDNANPDLVYPGQPVKFAYMDEGSLSEIYGTILGADHAITPTSTAMSQRRFQTRVELTLFLEKPEA